MAEIMHNIVKATLTDAMKATTSSPSLVMKLQALIIRVGCPCMHISWRNGLRSQSHFPAHGVIEALGAVFPQYWMMADCEEFFKQHISVIKAQYCYAKKIGLIRLGYQRFYLLCLWICRYHFSNWPLRVMLHQHGSSLHPEPYDLTLEKFVLFTNDCT
jgi:hypothetical protein